MTKNIIESLPEMVEEEKNEEEEVRRMHDKTFTGQVQEVVSVLGDDGPQ